MSCFSFNCKNQAVKDDLCLTCHKYLKCPHGRHDCMGIYPINVKCSGNLNMSHIDSDTMSLINEIVRYRDFYDSFVCDNCYHLFRKCSDCCVKIIFIKPNNTICSDCGDFNYDETTGDVNSSSNDIN